MNERRMKMAPGAAMLILILVVLTVSMLGVLTLMSARGDLTLSERSARLTEATCRLNAKAERTLAQLDALNAACGGDETALRAALPEGVTLDAQGTFVWREEVNGRALECAAVRTPQGIRWTEHRLLAQTEDEWND